MLNDCYKTLKKFELKKEEIFLFQKESESYLNGIEKKYLDQLISFFGKLLSSVNFLVNKQQLLYKKSKRGKVSWKEYNNAESQYKKSIDEYLIEGKKLNNLNSLIFQ